MWVTINTDGGITKVNTDFITLIRVTEKKIELVSGTQIRFNDAEFEEFEKTMFPTRKRVAKDDTEIVDFFNGLHRLTGGKNDAILTPQRKKKLTDLLKTFSKEQLELAAFNIGKDTFLQGENDNHKRYGDIDYLLRPDKAAKWAEYKPENKQKKMF